MWVLYSLLGLIALIIIVLLFVPIYGRITYDGELDMRFRLLGFPVSLLPRFEKRLTKRSHPSKGKTAREKRLEKREEKTLDRLTEIVYLIKQDDVGGTLHFLVEVAKLAAKTIGRILRSVRVKQLDLQILVGAENPDVTAQRYGQVCSVLYPALAGIEHVVRIRRRNVQVEPNFLLEQSVVRFDIKLRVSIWRLLVAIIGLLVGTLLIEEQDDPQITKEVS